MQSAAAMAQGLSSETALLVEGDQDYVKAIHAALFEDLSQIDAVTSIAGAVTRLQAQSYRLVIVDATLSGDPAPFDLARALRRTRPEVGIIMTSPVRLTATQVAACFEAGADEYVEKPFHPQEFAARVRAVSRRVRRSMASMSQTSMSQTSTANSSPEPITTPGRMPAHASVEQDLRATA